jgi:periplasmic copper chaperone A
VTLIHHRAEVGAFRGLLAAAALAGSLLLTGCGEDAASGDAAANDTAAESTLEVRDAWVKTAESGMTAIFAVLDNPGDTELTVVSAESEISPMELHEMAMSDGEMVMREKDGGFTVPAGGSHRLEPGGDHLMLMDLAEPILAGDELTVTLTFDTGESVTFTAVAKDFAGGDEEYEGGDHGDMEM